MRRKVIVIGSGLAGLASAIRMAVKGYRVQVFEANSYAGGKVAQLSGKGYRFDAGPSLFTMPHLVDDLFQLAGKNPGDYFRYHKLEVACRYFWDDDTELTAWADAERFAREAYLKTGVSEAAVLDYLAAASETFETTRNIFLENSLHRWQNFLRPPLFKALGKLHKLHLLSTLHELNKKKLSNPKLVQIFDRFATYNGSSPYLTPGVMSIIPHLEHNMGSYYPQGGIHAITTSLFQLAKELGVEFHFEEKVERLLIASRQLQGVVTSRARYSADLVFSNMDVVPTYRQLMPQQPAPEKTLSQTRSSSALIFYWGVKARFPQLDLHNIFFSNDYREEFRHIFVSGTISDDPTVYVNITAKQEAADAPEGAENWFVMVNVPPNTGQDWDQLIAETRSRVLTKLSKRLHRNIEELIEFEETLDPRTIESKTSSYQGALYGASSNNRLAAFLRHPNFSPRIKGLYFCGGSVHPGGGIPLVLLSAQIATELITE